MGFAPIKSPTDTATRQVDYRHPLPVRVWHWVNAAAVVALLMSGLLIFDIHPHLYWGEVGQEGKGAFLSLSGTHLDRAVPETQLQIGGWSWNTTGVLGSVIDDGFGGKYLLLAAAPEDWQFGATRGWHFAFAWFLGLGLPLYGVYLLASGRLNQVLLPTRGDLKPRNILHEFWQHARFKRARGESSRHYNLLQKVSYLLVIFVLTPAMILSGLSMSNTVTAAFPSLATLFGGHQSARSAHFIAAMLLFAFILVHILQVFVAGFFNMTRSMITGRFVVERGKTP
jgi:thiosulfate reductase cytochrome b subunit